MSDENAAAPVAPAEQAPEQASTSAAAAAETAASAPAAPAEVPAKEEPAHEEPAEEEPKPAGGMPYLSPTHRIHPRSAHGECNRVAHIFFQRTAAPEAAPEKADVEIKDAAEAAASTCEATTESAATEAATEKEAAAPAADAADAPAADKKERRKSGAASTPAKKLNKKGSRARILHLDAKPGEQYYVKLKGYPQWPAIICDEDMLPHNLIKSRPVTAARQDGTYREDYADGGRRAADRTFPVMYLFTNEL